MRQVAWSSAGLLRCLQLLPLLLCVLLQGPAAGLPGCWHWCWLLLLLLTLLLSPLVPQHHHQVQHQHVWPWGHQHLGHQPAAVQGRGGWVWCGRQTSGLWWLALQTQQTCHQQAAFGGQHLLLLVALQHQHQRCQQLLLQGLPWCQMLLRLLLLSWTRT